MSLSVSTIWELNADATASGVNGSGFNPANANMLTDLACDANTGNTNSPVVSSATYTFVAGDVGHWVYVKSGTNWTPGWYKIASVSGGKATLSAAIGEAVQQDTTKGSPSPKFGANTVAGCGTVATPTSGTFTIDYSQGTAAILALTDGASTDASAVLTSVTGGFTPVMVGNVLRLASGTNYVDGWFEIVSYNSATSVAVDRDCAGAGNLSSGVFKVGGAFSLNSTLDDDFFEQALGTNGSGAMRFFVKNKSGGGYLLGESISLATGIGGTQAPVAIEGYNLLRGDTPTGDNRPKIDCAAYSITLNTAMDVYNLRITGTGSNVLIPRTGGRVVNCKIVNTSTTASRNALYNDNGSNYLFNIELISYRGYAFNTGSASLVLDSCWLHESNTGLRLGSGGVTLLNTIISSNVAYAINSAAALTTAVLFLNSTLYGAENKTGVGVNLLTATTYVRCRNTILYGFVTGIAHADVQTQGFDDFNDYYNNTADVSNWQKGANDIAVAPAFTSVGQVTGTAGAFVAGNGKLVDTSKNFTNLGVVAGRDYVYIVSGTGATAGIYGISSISTTTNANDTLNLDISPGTNTTADKVYQITIGHNFLPTGVV